VDNELIKGMDKKSRNPGRACLIAEFQKRGLSRRRAKAILDFIFAEMKQALARDEPLESRFCWPMREEKISRHWELIGDEPMKPRTVECFTDAEGVKLLVGPENMLYGTGRMCIFFLSKEETPPYAKLRRPRGRPRRMNG
jgi:hypothetical protein